MTDNTLLEPIPVYIKSPVSSKSIADFVDLRGHVDVLCLRWIVSKKSMKKSKRKANLVISAAYKPEIFQMKNLRTAESLQIPSQTLGLTKFRDKLSA